LGHTPYFSVGGRSGGSVFDANTPWVPSSFFAQPPSYGTMNVWYQ